MHLILPNAAGLLQGPQDAYVTDHHPGECGQDLAGEHLLKVGESSHNFGRWVGKGEAEHQHGEAQPVLDVFELPEHNREEDGDEAIQADAGEEERAAGVFHAVGELESGPHVFAVPVVKVKDADGGHDAKVDVHKGQAAEEDVWSGRILTIADENGDNQHIGGDPHDDVDALQRHVKEDALHHVLATVKHTEGLHRGVAGSCDIERELSCVRGHGERWSCCIPLHDSTKPGSWGGNE